MDGRVADVSLERKIRNTVAGFRQAARIDVGRDLAIDLSQPRKLGTEDTLLIGELAMDCDVRTIVRATICGSAMIFSQWAMKASWFREGSAASRTASRSS